MRIYSEQLTIHQILLVFCIVLNQHICIVKKSFLNFIDTFLSCAEAQEKSFIHNERYFHVCQDAPAAPVAALAPASSRG